MRKAVIVLTALLGCVIFSLGLGTTSAWAQGEAVRGTLRSEGQPVPNVTINVLSADGQPVGTTESAADGGWQVAVPGPGSYRVDLDESTLPSGLRVRTGNPSLTVPVATGQARAVLFPLGTDSGPGAGADPSASPGAEPGETGDGDGDGDPTVAPEDADVEVAGGSGRVGQAVTLAYSGLHFGLVIALAALGLSLIFGTMGLTNFAHGELVTFGAVMAYLVNVGLGLPLLLAIPVAVALGAAFGWLQDKFFWGWLRKRGTGLIAMMIISIGVALLLRNIYLYAVGGETRRYTDYVTQSGLEFGPLTVAPRTLVSDIVAVVVLVGVGLALVMSRLGKATRAVADNPALAAASGINVDAIIRLVWAIGGALAALAGVLLALGEGIGFEMGFRILLLIFAAVVLGGLGTAFGALVGALLVGFLVQISTLWIPTELKYVGALGVLIVVLLVRPQGILGRSERIG